MSNKKVVIVIPTHRSYLTADDEVSLAYLKKYLSKYDTYFIIPKSASKKAFVLKGYKVKQVDNCFFGTVRKYSNLLLNKNFYEFFEKYDFMMIYQLDALILSDQMEKWINSGYDYIGSPWFRPLIGCLSHKNGSPSSGGNGGFCLRNIQKSIHILDIVNRTAKRHSDNLLIRKLWFLIAVITGKSHDIWLKAPALDYPFYEDGFWALEAPKYVNFRVAPFKTSLQFGFERFPRKSYQLNNNKLPFGVHAWKKYDLNFWEQYIKLKTSI